MMNLFPFVDVVQRAKEVCATGNARCFQQFNCASCGTKQTMAEPNRFYTKGKCEECGHITDIWADGCNHLLMLGPPTKGTPEPEHGRKQIIVANSHGNELAQQLADLGIKRGS